MSNLNSRITQPLTTDEISNLLDFVGYGNLDGPVWFLGMEEGGGGEERIRIQSNFERIEDLRDAHVNKMGITRHHCGNRVLQSTWKRMCHIMLSLAGVPYDVSTLRTYQANHLGSFGGDTLVTELMPVAKSNIRDWPYGKLIPMFRDRNHYYEEVLPARLLRFTDLVSTYQPRLIVAYGRSYWKHYELIVGPIEFQDSGRFRYGKNGQTAIVLTDHFTARTMNNLTADLVALIRTISPDLGFHLRTKIAQ